MEVHLHPARRFVAEGSLQDDDESSDRSHGQGMTQTAERRTRARVLLHCPLRLYRRGLAQPVQGETLDLSSAGFYCKVPEPFAPSDNLDCILTVPAENFGPATGDV